MNIDVQFVSQVLFSSLVTGVLVFVFQKVIERRLSKKIELFKADLHRTIQNEARTMKFVERQLEEFYSPMMGCLRKTQAKSLLRLEINNASDAAWRKICEEHPKPFLDHEEYFKPFMKSINYDNEELRREIMPLYDEMITIFTDKYWLANPSTRRWFPELSAFVGLWHRWLDKSIPAEVIKEIGHSEDQLNPFYEDLEVQIDELYKSLTG
jgi:hypothetical protein